MLTELVAETTGRLVSAGVAPGDVVIERVADMRLLGQLHEIQVALPEGGIDEAAMPSRSAARRIVPARATSSR